MLLRELSTIPFFAALPPPHTRVLLLIDTHPYLHGQNTGTRGKISDGFGCPFVIIIYSPGKRIQKLRLLLTRFPIWHQYLGKSSHNGTSDNKIFAPYAQ